MTATIHDNWISRGDDFRGRKGLERDPAQSPQPVPGGGAVETVPGLRQEADRETDVSDCLAAEQPLQIVVNGKPFSMTLCTPGHERFLVRGLLHGEGALDSSFLLYRQTAMDHGAEVQVEISCEGLNRDARRLMSVSSCGLCGKPSADRLLDGVEPVERRAAVSASVLALIHARARDRQPVFHRSGGCHAACAATVGGEVLCVFEDIGRHNAVDKVIGFLLENALLSRADVLAVSGRVSLEIVLKCARAGIPVLSAVSAPTALAARMAARWGITLAAFCREDRATFYSGANRITRPAAEMGMIET